MAVCFAPGDHYDKYNEDEYDDEEEEENETSCLSPLKQSACIALPGKLVGLESGNGATTGIVHPKKVKLILVIFKQSNKLLVS